MALFICDFPIDGVKSSSKKSVLEYMLSKVSEHLSSYISACQEDPNLKSFDSTLYQRTQKMISSLSVAAKTENQYLPLHSLTVVYEYISELSQDVVKTIIESNDVWKDEEVRSLVDFYFKNTAKTSELINTVENCVKRAEISQLIIRFAVKQFETESVVDTDLGARSKKKNKYAKTLEELNKFKAKGDPLGEEFVTLYKSIYKQQVLFLQELCKQKVKLDKKQKKLKIWRKLSNVMFGTALVTCVVLSIVPLGLSPHVMLGAAVLTAPIAAAGKWVSGLLKVWEKAVDTLKGFLTSTEHSTNVNNQAMETISILVEELRVRISSILESVDFAVEREEDEEATRLAMQDIMKKVEGFTEKIQKVGEIAAKCGESINSGRVQVLEHIANSKGM